MNSVRGVAADGGSAEEVTSGSFNWDPSFLPIPGKSLLLIHLQDPTESAVWIVDLETGDRRRIGKGVSPVYSPTGHILYQDAGPSPKIWAVRFLPDKLETAGRPFVVAEDAAAPSVADDGTLVYLRGAGGIAKRVVWRDGSGQLIDVVSGPLQEARYVDLSPDGTTAAVTAVNQGNRDVWLVGVGERRGEPRRLTFAATPDGKADWSPDGRQVVYTGNTNLPSRGLYLKEVSGKGAQSE